MPRELLDLNRPAAWPAELRSYLDAHHDLFLGWEHKHKRVSPGAYDEAIYGLIDVLEPYAIAGWHCTRLTDAEVNEILRNGMQLPNAEMIMRRIDALLKANQITPNIARRLKKENQCNDANRAGMIWFCFYPPLLAGERGIGRFFRHWGGEALYNSHENDQVTSPAISCVGTPCIVEANVPIASLERHGGLPFKIIRRFLISRGFKTSEPTNHDGQIKHLLPAENIQRVIRYPDPDFLSLTGCSEWRRPISCPDV
jgi:hypothetical protein